MLHTYYTCTTDVLHTYYTRTTHVLHKCYTRTTHVLHTYYTRTTHVLHTYYTRTTHVLHTYYTRTTRVLHVYYTCTTRVLHVYYTRTAHILHTYYTRTSPVLMSTDLRHPVCVLPRQEHQRVGGPTDHLRLVTIATAPRQCTESLLATRMAVRTAPHYTAFSNCCCVLCCIITNLHHAQDTGVDSVPVAFWDVKVIARTVEVI